MKDDTIRRQAAIDELNRESRCGAVIDHCGLETAIDIIRDLPSAETEQRWTPCSERLPTTPGRYLVTQKRPYGMYVETAYFDRNEFWDEAVAWMPLPEPYKEDMDD